MPPATASKASPSAALAQQGAKDFSAPAWQKATSDAQIQKAIREGKKGTMMASFASQLSAGQIEGLARYIRTLGGKK